MNNPKQIFTQHLIQAVQRVFDHQAESDIANSVSYCEPRFGQFSSNLAFRLAGATQKKPNEVAKLIIVELEKSEVIAKAEFMEPGFINVRLNDSVWGEYFVDLNENFLQSSLGQGRRVQIEFISANPTGPLVLTNAWQGYYGDILANIYASQGYLVEREYYLNDGGNQIVALGQAIQQSLGAKFDDKVAENLYRGEYIDKIAEIITTEYGGSNLVRQAEPMHIGQKAAEAIVDIYIKPDLARLGVRFDSLYSESKPDIKATLSRLDEAGLSQKKDGAVWLVGKKVGLSQDEVLVRSYDGGYTYFLKDIAYQLERLEGRGFDQTITIVGPDHHGQAIRLVNTMKALGHDGFSEIATQTIRLVKDGKEFKMSKRKGNYVLLKDFLDSVPTEAARFYFAMRDTNTHMDFDIDLIGERSAKNPVYYSLYAYARACSIQQKASNAGIEPSVGLDQYQLSEAEQRLILEISKLPLIVQDITYTQKVQQLLHQTVQVARAFHEFYETEKVIGGTDDKAKLLLIQHFRLAYEAIFRLIGVSLVEKM